MICFPCHKNISTLLLEWLFNRLWLRVIRQVSLIGYFRCTWVHPSPVVVWGSGDVFYVLYLWIVFVHVFVFFLWQGFVVCELIYGFRSRLGLSDCIVSVYGFCSSINISHSNSNLINLNHHSKYFVISAMNWYPILRDSA